MQVIMRYLSEKNLKRFEIDFKNLIKIVNNSEGELDIAIRENYLNIYYKGNSLAKISLNKLDKYKVEIHKKFFEGTNADNPNFWDEKTESDNYISFSIACLKKITPAIKLKQFEYKL